MSIKNQYLTYEEYQSLGGTKDIMSFNKLEYKARKYIDNKTFGRLKELEEQKEETKKCIYELISELGNTYEQNDITSEKVGDYSVTYENVSEKDQEINNNKIIDTYLSECYLEDGTPYLYCGV